MAARWHETAREKLELLRELAAASGGEPLAYCPDPPLAPEIVDAFEAEHGIELPTDYRDFVLHIGDGGIGPDFGIGPLEDCDGVHRDSIEIGEIGRGSFIRLGVGGGARGRIFADDDGQLVPLAASFSDWIDDWIQVALAQELGNAAREALARGQRGSNAVARGAEVLRDRASSDQGAAAALLSLGRCQESAAIVARLDSEGGECWTEELRRYLH